MLPPSARSARGQPVTRLGVAAKFGANCPPGASLTSPAPAIIEASPAGRPAKVGAQASERASKQTDKRRLVKSDGHLARSLARLHWWTCSASRPPNLGSLSPVLRFEGPIIKRCARVWVPSRRPGRLELSLEAAAANWILAPAAVVQLVRRPACSSMGSQRGERRAETSWGESREQNQNQNQRQPARKRRRANERASRAARIPTWRRQLSPPVRQGARAGPTRHVAPGAWRQTQARNWSSRLARAQNNPPPFAKTHHLRNPSFQFQAQTRAAAD